MSLKGERELRARLKALRLAFKPIGKDWANEGVRQMRPRVPVRTGRLRQSFRVRNATQRRAVVGGHFTAYFVDKGPKPHDIRAKTGGTLVFQGRRGTVFARSVHHRGYRGRPFRQKAADEALRKTPMAQEVIRQWNNAA